MSNGFCWEGVKMLTFTPVGPYFNKIYEHCSIMSVSSLFLFTLTNQYSPDSFIREYTVFILTGFILHVTY